MQTALYQILRLIEDTPLDLSGISAIRGALRRQELSLTNEGEREVDDRADAGRQLRVGRGWLEAKLIRGHGPGTGAIATARVNDQSTSARRRRTETASSTDRARGHNQYCGRFAELILRCARRRRRLSGTV